MESKSPCMMYRVGTGSYASVYAENDGNNHSVIKVNVDPVIDAKENQLNAACLREIAFLRRINHPGVVSLLGHSVGYRGMWGGRLVLQLERHGSSLRGVKLSQPETKRFLHQVAGALAHAHAQNSSHGDVKPDNVLRRANRYIVIDWGLANLLCSDEQHSLNGMCQTRYYRANEVQDRTETDARRADVWALAVTALELCVATNISRFEARSDIEQVVWNKRFLEDGGLRREPVRFPHLDAELRDLLDQMLRPSDERISAIDIMRATSDTSTLPPAALSPPAAAPDKTNMGDWIPPRLRTAVLTWMAEVAQNRKTRDVALFHAIELLDRAIMKGPVGRESSDIYHMATACLAIASALYDSSSISLTTWVVVVSYAPQPVDTNITGLGEMVMQILHAVDWHLWHATPYTVLFDKMAARKDADAPAAAAVAAAERQSLMLILASDHGLALTAEDISSRVMDAL